MHPGVPDNKRVLVENQMTREERDTLSIDFDQILKNPATQVSRGVCFVRYSTYEEASAAIAALNGTVPPGGASPLHLKFAREGTKAHRS